MTTESPLDTTWLMSLEVEVTLEQSLTLLLAAIAVLVLSAADVTPSVAGPSPLKLGSSMFG